MSNNQIPTPAPGYMSSAMPVGTPSSTDAYVISNTSTPVIVPGTGGTTAAGPWAPSLGMVAGVATSPGQGLTGTGNKV